MKSTLPVASALFGAALAVFGSGAQAQSYTLDFGTGFDCFDPISRTAAKDVSNAAQANRKRLVSLMDSVGFRNYAGEWWHFTLRGEPFPAHRFDFLVTSQ